LESYHIDFSTPLATPAPWPLGANNFLLDQKVIKKSSSLKALALGHHSKKPAMPLCLNAALFVRYAVSEQGRLKNV